MNYFRMISHTVPTSNLSLDTMKDMFNCPILAGIHHHHQQLVLFLGCQSEANDCELNIVVARILKLVFDYDSQQMCNGFTVVP